MKISPSLWSTPVVPSPEVRTLGTASKETVGATHVTVSPEARWIADVRHEARHSAEVREELVERTRSAIRDGTYEKSVDLDAVIRRLLAGA